MDETTRKNLAGELYFSQEAARYLGITLQRLEELVGEGQLRPIKRTAAESVYLREELEACRAQKPRRKKETVRKNDADMGRPAMQKAINYFTLRSLCGGSDQKAEEIFRKLGEKTELGVPMEEAAPHLAEAAGISSQELIAKSRRIGKAFKTLQHNDLAVDRDSEEYPQRLRGRKNAPYYLFLRGDARLLEEKIVALEEKEGGGPAGEKEKVQMVNGMAAAGLVPACIAGQAGVAGESVILKNCRSPIVVLDGPLPDEEQESLLSAAGEKGLILSAMPPAGAEDGQPVMTEKELLEAISCASVQLGESGGFGGIALWELRQQLAEAEREKNVNCENAAQGQADDFSKGIRVEYVYNDK